MSIKSFSSLFVIGLLAGCGAAPPADEIGGSASDTLSAPSFELGFFLVARESCGRGTGFCGYRVAPVTGSRTRCPDGWWAYACHVDAISNELGLADDRVAIAQGGVTTSLYTTRTVLVGQLGIETIGRMRRGILHASEAWVAPQSGYTFGSFTLASLIGAVPSNDCANMQTVSIGDWTKGSVCNLTLPDMPNDLRLEGNYAVDYVDAALRNPAGVLSAGYHDSDGNFVATQIFTKLTRPEPKPAPHPMESVYGRGQLVLQEYFRADWLSYWVTQTNQVFQGSLYVVPR